ncbi:MAG TPA: nuclear transport factor 2 family protein [Hyphomicrobiaceae bacterium]|nr:nuclear transport factor 2 family protein [Hyphomicrobiaceae bacterium]
MAREVTIALLDEIQDGFNKQDVDAILSHFADDCEWLMARGPNAPEGCRLLGKAAIGEVLRARYKDIPDMRWEEMRHWIVDQTKAISEWIVRGTPKNGGEPINLVGCDLWEFRDGYVTKKDTYWKTIT